jgi:hypothetical protein
MLRHARHTGVSFVRGGSVDDDWDGDPEDGDGMEDNAAEMARIPFPMRGGDSDVTVPTAAGGASAGRSHSLPLEDSLLASVGDFEGGELHLHWNTMAGSSGPGLEDLGGSSDGAYLYDLGSPAKPSPVAVVTGGGGSGGSAVLPREGRPRVGAALSPGSPAAARTTVERAGVDTVPAPRPSGLAVEPVEAVEPGEGPQPSPLASPASPAGRASPQKSPSPTRRRQRRVQRLLPEPDLRTAAEVATDVAIAEASMQQETIDRRVRLRDTVEFE